MIDLEHLAKERPTPIRARESRILPLTDESLDFLRECLDDVWNTGPDTQDTLDLSKLLQWSVGWHSVDRLWLGLPEDYPDSGTLGYVKEALIDNALDPSCQIRVQCVVRNISRTRRPVPSIKFAWEQIEG